MDVSLLILVAARVRELDPETVLGELDIEAAQRCVDKAELEGADNPLRQASSLLYSIVRERPFRLANDLIALITAAQLLEQGGVIVTFQPEEGLMDLLARIKSGEAAIDEVEQYVRLRAPFHEEKTAMFERFTPRARQAMSEANHAAETLQHNFIGTEHLLLGLLAVTDGIGAQVLRELGVDGDEVQRQVRDRVGPGPKAVVGRYPFTPRSKQVLEQSLRNALSFGHNYIGTEHMLLGLLEVPDGLAAQILQGMGVTLAGAEEGVTGALTSRGWTPPPKRTRRRLWQRGFPTVTVQPTSPATQVRNQRLLQEMTAIITENDALRAEVTRLRRLLEDHEIDPGQPASGERPA
jgi:hypothetical protein